MSVVMFRVENETIPSRDVNQHDALDVRRNERPASLRIGN